MYIVSPPTPQATKEEPQGKKKLKSATEAAEKVYEDMEDIAADSIKRLYNEDSGYIDATTHIPPSGNNLSSGSCATQIRQDKVDRISPVPPLQSIQVT